MKTAKLLENDRLRLRAPEPEDLEHLYLWENDPDTWQVSGTLVPFSRHVLRLYLENAGKDIYEQKQLRLMMEPLDPEPHPGRKIPAPIGTIDLFDFDPYHRRAGVGILVAEKSERRKGYAREALALLMAYGFEKLGLKQLWCNIGPDNQASLELFTAAGFKVCGKKEQWNFDGKQFRDEWLLQALNPKSQILTPKP